MVKRFFLCHGDFSRGIVDRDVEGFGRSRHSFVSDHFAGAGDGRQDDLIAVTLIGRQVEAGAGTAGFEGIGRAPRPVGSVTGVIVEEPLNGRSGNGVAVLAGCTAWEIGLVDRGADGGIHRRAGARAVVSEYKVGPKTNRCSTAAAITIFIDDRIGSCQGNQVARKAYRIVRVATVRMHDGTLLIKRDITVGVYRESKDYIVITVFPLHDSAIHTQYDRITRRSIDQTGRLAGIDSERVGTANTSGTIRSIACRIDKVVCKVIRKIRCRIFGQIGLVHG